MRRTWIAARCAVAMYVCSGVSVSAEIELRSTDGLLSFQGEVVSFEDELITLKGGFGQITLPAAVFHCFGDDCPDGIAKGAVSKSIDVAFDSPDNRSLFLDILGSPFVPRQSGVNVTFTKPDVVEIATADAGDRATLRLGATTYSNADLQILTTPSHFSTHAPAGFDAREIGVQAYGVVVGQAAGVNSVSIDTLAHIYAGEVTNWSEVGGNDVDVMPIRVAEGHPAYDILLRDLIDTKGKSLGLNVVSTRDERLAIATLGIAPGGLTIVSLDATGASEPVGIVDGCGQIANPNAFDIANGNYPLTVSTIATINSNEMDGADALLSPIFDALATTGTDELQNAHPILVNGDVRAQRVASVLESQYPEGVQDTARALVANLFVANRLSITLSGEQASMALKARNRPALVRLAQAVERGDFDGQEIMFLGFAADTGDPDGAIVRSKDAASRMLNAFRALAPAASARSGVKYFADGHGPVSQRICEANAATPDSSFVEIWIRPAT